MPDITPYKDQLLQTVDKLFELRHQIFTQVINLSMANEMKEVDDAFEEGDEFQFDIASFEDSSDTNLNLLVDLVKHIQTTHDSLCNINSIAFDNDEDKYFFR